MPWDYGVRRPWFASLIAPVYIQPDLAVTIHQYFFHHFYARVAPAMVFPLAVLLARGLRFRVLTTRAGLVTVTAAIGVHNFLVRIIPFRLGELSLPYLLARQEPLTRTLLSLVLVRLLELWM